MEGTVTSGQKPSFDTLAGVINDFPIYKLALILVIAGYVVIGFSGHMNDWWAWLRYVAIVGIAFSVSIILHYWQTVSPSKPGNTSGGIGATYSIDNE